MNSRDFEPKGGYTGSNYPDGLVLTNIILMILNHVVDAGELEVIASSDHCKIAACKHPTRPIHTVQYHPEAVSEVLDVALACGDMNHEERSAYDDKRLTTDVSIAFKL